jgi:beta-lactamase superfamily II metal-dependent hydrolase
MTALTVAAYNVKFGDAILIAVPERTRRATVVRHILIDVGNVLGGDSEVFSAVMEDVLRRLDRRPVDLYVMTHEHMDHVQDLLRAHSAKQRLPVIEYAWLTGSAHPRYRQRFPEARKQIELYRAAYDRVRLAATQRGLLGLTPVRAFLANNDPRSTGDCVAFLRQVARKRTCYVDRTFKPVPGRHHSFREARFSIWAPERDTTSYYGRMRPAAPVLFEGGRQTKWPRAPAGVSQDALNALVKFACSGLGDNMLAIDRAANNTSVVLELEWRGWRLLFSGDAELRSWRTMDRHGQLRPVHFLKVGHHASHNGTPPDALLEKILPMARADKRARYALVSTCAATYSGVPDDQTLSRIAGRVDRVYVTSEVEVGKAVEIEFEGPA